MSDLKRNLEFESETARALLANVRDVIGDDEELSLTVVEGETRLIEAIGAAVDRVREIETLEAAIGGRIKELQSRKERLDRQSELIRSAVCVAMGAADLKKLELAEVTVSRKLVAPKVEITNEADIPSEFWKPSDPKLDRKALMDALKDKRIVPGAVLSNGSETIAIRGG